VTGVNKPAQGALYLRYLAIDDSVFLPGTDGLMIRRLSVSVVGFAVLVYVSGVLLLALVALLRARREDIPAIVRALARWWR